MEIYGKNQKYELIKSINVFEITAGMVYIYQKHILHRNLCLHPKNMSIPIQNLEILHSLMILKYKNLLFFLSTLQYPLS